MDLTEDQVKKYTKMFEIPEDISSDEVKNDVWFAFVGFD